MIDFQGTYNNTRVRMSPFTTKGKKGGVDVYFPAIKATLAHAQHAIRIVNAPFYNRHEATRMASTLLRHEMIQMYVYDELKKRLKDAGE